jgi:tripartite ATP-independent transporter DctM subunit
MSLLLGSFLVLMAIGFPVAMALGGASMLFVFIDERIPLLAVVHRTADGVNSFPLMCVPFFIMAGLLMNTAGITERIYSFAVALVGWMKGGLGQVNVVGSVIFSGMSGTAVADAAGLGTIEIKAMKDHGYDPEFAVGITAASSILGPLMPPSLPMVLFALTANASIGQLFAAGILPGLVLAGMLMLMVGYFAHVRGYHRDARFKLRELGRQTLRAFLPMMTPVILIGGMRIGAFTPTEAAIVACAYALFLGFFVYRSLTFKALAKVSIETVEITAVVLLIVAGSEIFGWLITTTKIADQIADIVLAITDRPWLILLLVNIFLLLVGLAMEPVPCILILTPILLPLM